MKKKIQQRCPPVSPILSESIGISIFSLSILIVVELETSITETETLELLRNDAVLSHTRFSSIMVTDKNGVKRWKKIDYFRVEDHLIVRTFPSGLEREENLREYLSKIGSESFSEEKPMWEVHLIKNNGPNNIGSTGGGSLSPPSTSTLIFKLSHALGDGYSFIGPIFKAFKRADDPSLPFTYPRIYIFDKPSPIRSATTNKMDLFRPFSIYTVTLSLERVKQVKSKLGATVNDVLMGIISYVIHLYMSRTTGGGHNHQVSINGARSTSMTIMVMINMRMLKGYKNIEEMIKANTWGNHSRFLQVTIPSVKDLEEINPLDFIIKAKETKDRKKNSHVCLPYEPVLNTTWRIGGQKEQGAVAGHPVSDAYFIVTGMPQSITFTSASYMEQLKLVVTMEKGFIDFKLFTSCMDEAFENIFQAAFGNCEAT
ncbi:hypothetical protein BVC80_1825g1 [Macleaya cordata]|uniref:O-acyltransferase WSD1 C-terminal domain-containing protein n=1 Tax=Macleaya cordata TaxID=56857 RepID=A0A200QZ76_MACCD|nr:hypothetical protein BVC80_1825g1 [Macleaya cordata]